MNWRERGPRHRPGWWPADEQWPPTGQNRQRFVGRMAMRFGCFLVVLFVMVFAALAVVFWLIASALGAVSIPPATFVWVVPLGGLTLLMFAGGIFSMVRGIRHSFLPLRDLLRGAEAVADGDFKVRVPERGPREMREAARVFNRMAERLQANAENRRDLLADVTHELRTPLTIMQGNLEGLIDGVYPANEEHLKLILAETTRLSGLVDDLRTLALAESGALVLKKEPTDLTLLARETAAAFRSQADAAGVTLRVEDDKDVPRVAVDPGRIHEALANLIANALRYTTKGGAITIRLGLDRSEDDERVVLSVEDTGAGISADNLPHIFDRFHRSSDSGGMGLGLAITKNLIAAHGGEISAISTPGAGTTIRITLPVGD